MKMKMTVMAFATLIVILGSQNANAVPITLNFDGGGGAASPIQLSGYQISLNSGNFTSNGFGGSPLFIGNAGAQATLTRLNGGPFNFDSIDFAAGDPAINVTFTASNGEQDIFSTNSPSISLTTHFLPSTFDDITSVVWNQGTASIDAYVFDNLVVESVPEPGILGLATIGLLGMSFRRRKRA